MALNFCGAITLSGIFFRVVQLLLLAGLVGLRVFSFLTIDRIEACVNGGSRGV